MKFDVEISGKIINRFKKIAKKSFPLESYAIFLGEITEKGQVSIQEMYIPEDLSKYVTEEAVTVPQHWFEDAQIIAQDKGFMVLGDIHSHCFWEKSLQGIQHEPSEADWKAADYTNKNFCGSYCCHAICRIIKRGEKLRATIKFWPVISEVKTKIVK